MAPMFNTSAGHWDESYPGNREENIIGPRPAGNGRGPARELARVYECLLNRGRVPNAPPEGMRSKILTRQTIEAMTARHRVNMLDLTFNKRIDWGLGFIINSAHYGENPPYGFGPHASARTFGHAGSQSSIAFADPERHLAAAILFNGMPGEPQHQLRIDEVLRCIYDDLQLSN
jgi:CubicO group peptidase (beta-lactamase class C family)